MLQKKSAVPLILTIILLITACEPQADMPNPASVFCEENGGKLIIREDDSGGQIGFCVFEDGSECEEWAFYRGECKPGNNAQTSADMPNPASVFCEENDGKLEIRTDESGAQTGFCIFEDGSECDEWAFYRGECKPGDSLEPKADMPNPASAFCEDQGGTLKIESDAYGAQIGMCIFEDGSACEEWAFYNGKCQVGGIYSVDEIASDGCKVFRNEQLGYGFHFPSDAVITSAGDPNKTITVQGALKDNEHWPVFFINHPNDRSDFTLPEDIELEEWLEQNNLLFAEPKYDIEIAGEKAIHMRQTTGEQAYDADHFFFAKGSQIYNIVILHTGGIEDWTLYEHFLTSFEFD